MNKKMTVYTINLPSGDVKHVEVPITGMELAKSISPSLAKKSVAMRVNGDCWDLTRLLPHDATVSIITNDSDEGLDIIRHDMAHLFAQAVKQLYPSVQITIGPSIEDGFYYDIDAPTPLSSDDFPLIEERMRQLIDQNLPFVREEWSQEQAISYFSSIGEHFKVELIKAIPADQVLTIYRQGDFIDLCRGPHLPSTGMVPKSFKLLKIAGAYWRGNHQNPMLQRIYGTGWLNEQELKDYLHRLEEAQKRDHRRLGQELDLFHLQEEAPGSVFWHPHGWTIYRLLQDFVRGCLERDDYVEVRTPQILDRTLWEKSGHWDKFYHNMFCVQDGDDRMMAIKPMNCPGHVQIFKQGIKSYRDLPIRMAEFGACVRNEPSGALHGLMRVRSFEQDDAHIFCTPEQIVEETKRFCTLLQTIYKKLGFDQFKVKFSDRPAVRAGDDVIWDQAESALKEASKAAGLDFTLNPGEGAFYGPKLEFVLQDSIGRQWQCGTLQVDFVLPQRLDATYIAADGKKHRPVMLHRAVLGSFERFIGIMIEHYSGKFPFWLSPVQAVVATVTDASTDFAHQVIQTLKDAGLRVSMDLRNEKISYKVREHSLKKIPYILVVGEKEAQSGCVAVRTLGSVEQRVMTVGAFMGMTQTILQEL
jgi:threonyl-tRNA synthetase